MKLTIILFAALFLAGAQAICPNRCSGHGTCGSSDKCTCEAGFTDPDCSGRVCAYGLSWVPAADSSSNAVPMGDMGGQHAYAECSSKGKCDRTTGICECSAGYTGKGCRRQLCPGEASECSGHGLCKFADAISGYGATNGDKFSSMKWDGRKTRYCACDRGWEGIDCSLRTCPKGDDPLTDCDNSNQADSVQKITVTSMDPNFAANGYIALRFTDMYGGNYTTKSIRLSANYYPMDSITNVNGDKCNNANFPCYSSTTSTHSSTINPADQYQLTGAGHSFFDADAIREALQALPNFAVPSVNVTEQIDVLEYTDTVTKYYYTSHSATDCGFASGSAPNGEQCGQSIFYVTFTDAGNSGLQDLMDCYVGSTTETLGMSESNSRECSAAQPRLSKIDISGLNHQITCTVEHVALAAGSSYEENSECSERGVCDSTTGVCACYEGHSGEDCSKQTIFF